LACTQRTLCADKKVLRNHHFPASNLILKLVLFLGLPSSGRSLPSRLSPRSLDAVIDLTVAGFDGELARAELDRPLHRAIAGINVPAPTARLDLLNVIRDRSV
jgi:hypothetical protein